MPNSCFCLVLKYVLKCVPGHHFAGPLENYQAESNSQSAKLLSTLYVKMLL